MQEENNTDGLEKPAEILLKNQKLERHENCNVEMRQKLERHENCNVEMRPS